MNTLLKNKNSNKTTTTTNNNKTKQNKNKNKKTKQNNKNKIKNKNKNKNASGGPCARVAKRPRVGRFPRCVFVSVFVFVLLYVSFEFD